MAIKFLVQQEKQNLLVIVFIMVILLTVLVAFLGFSRKKGITFIPPITPPPPKKMEINFSVLESAVVKELETLEQVNLPEQIGRENPFLPY